MLRKPILLLAILMGLWACNNKSSVPGIQLIDFTGDLNNETGLMLSDLATDIKYIPLESSKDSYVQYMMDWSLSENYLLIYDYMHPLVYNRKTKELVYVEKKIPNDLDGGMNFWPGRITGNKVYSLVNANNFTYYRENGYFYDGEVKNPDKKIALNKMVDSIDENDNPILVIVTLKE